ncbi:HamA C-terminal domain-containing protein [Chryseobacterium wanjuense]
MKTDSLKAYTKNLIFMSENFSVGKYSKNTFHLDYTSKVYRQKDLVGLIRETVPYFALTEEEFKELEFIDFNRTAWSRISQARKDKKGDYGELLLYLIMTVYYNAPKFVTKVRLRSSVGMQINGYDCAHFTIENNEPILWLGESKFHQSFSTALTESFKSLDEHCKILYTSNEISILKPNIEINKDLESNFLKLKSVFAGKSIDKIKFRIPVLLTYDSNTIKNNEDINEKFKKDLETELKAHHISIEGKDVKNELKNVEFVFFIFPLHTVSTIKSDLEIIETAMRI